MELRASGSLPEESDLGLMLPTPSEHAMRERLRGLLGLVSAQGAQYSGAGVAIMLEAEVSGCVLEHGKLPFELAFTLEALARALRETPQLNSFGAGLLLIEALEL